MTIWVTGILSVEELQAFASTIELFVTEQEGRRMLANIDIGNDEKVLEADFIEFMKRKDDVLKKQGQRLRFAGNPLIYTIAWIVRCIVLLFTVQRAKFVPGCSVDKSVPAC
jgi:hypothetical protein